MENEKEHIPLFGKWRYWYMLVIGWLILLIVVFYFFTRHFS